MHHIGFERLIVLVCHIIDHGTRGGKMIYQLFFTLVLDPASMRIMQHPRQGDCDQVSESRASPGC